MTSHFANITSSSSSPSFFFRCYFVFLVKFTYWLKFHVNIITGSGVMTFYFIRDWPEIRKLEIPPSEFCPISGDWGGLRIQNLARTTLIKCYWILKNNKITAFIVSEKLRENQQREGKGESKITPQIQIMVKLWPYAITRSIVFFRVTIRHFKDEKISLIKLHVMTTTIV